MGETIFEAEQYTISLLLFGYVNRFRLLYSMLHEKNDELKRTCFDKLLVLERQYLIIE